MVNNQQDPRISLAKAMAEIRIAQVMLEGFHHSIYHPGPEGQEHNGSVSVHQTYPPDSMIQRKLYDALIAIDEVDEILSGAKEND
jgi:hypothetical protein